MPLRRLSLISIVAVASVSHAAESDPPRAGQARETRDRQVYAARDLSSFEEMARAVGAKDHKAIVELTRSRRIVPVPAGTRFFIISWRDHPLDPSGGEIVRARPIGGTPNAAHLWFYASDFAGQRPSEMARGKPTDGPDDAGGAGPESPSGPASVRRAGGEPEKAVHPCGAITRDGTPCRRPVAGAGRCYQHKGQ